LNLYKTIVKRLCGAAELFAVLCLAAMVVVVLVQVIGRYVFSNTPSWSEEMARQFMIAFSFIGIAIGVRDKIHIALTFIVDLGLKKIRLPLEILGKMLIVVLGIMMSINMGPYFTKLRYNRLPGTGIPVGWMYVIPTVIGVLIALIAVYQVYDHFKYGTDEKQARRQESLQEKIAQLEEHFWERLK